MSQFRASVSKEIFDMLYKSFSLQCQLYRRFIPLQGKGENLSRIIDTGIDFRAKSKGKSL